jgi:uncharacterized membrane protein YiaA
MPVTNVFLSMCWGAFFAAVSLLIIGLYNAEMMLSEKGFYGISFVLSLFAVVTAQKNVRDVSYYSDDDVLSSRESVEGRDDNDES